MVKDVKEILLDDFWIMPATPEYIETGVPYITSKNIKNGKIDFSKANYISLEAYEAISKNRPILVGDILISMIGTLGETAEVTLEDGMFYGQNMFLIRLDESVVNKRYFLNYFKSNLVKRTLAGKQNQSTQKYLKANHIEDLQIPILSLEEQECIAEILDKIQRIIVNRKQELQKLDDLIKARFVELMQANPTSNILKEFISSYKAERCGDRDIPVLSITKENGIVYQSDKFKKRIASVDASTYKVVPRGKLVQGIHIDERNFAIQNIIDEGIVSPAYKIWNVDETKAIPEVLAFAMRTDKTMAYISSKYTGTIKRRESISMNDFMSTPIDLPDMTVQLEFYEFMKQVDKLKVEVRQSLNETQMLMDSLMQQYFG